MNDFDSSSDHQGTQDGDNGRDGDGEGHRGTQDGDRENILSNEQAFNVLMSCVDDRVQRKLHETFERTQRWAIAGLSLAVVLITSVGGVFFNFFTDRANTFAERAAEAAVAGELGATAFDARIAALNFRIVSP